MTCADAGRRGACAEHERRAHSILRAQNATTALHLFSNMSSRILHRTLMNSLASCAISASSLTLFSLSCTLRAHISHVVASPLYSFHCLYLILVHSFALLLFSPLLPLPASLSYTHGCLACLFMHSASSLAQRVCCWISRSLAPLRTLFLSRNVSRAP